jgi:hypothetical protein
VEPDALNTPDAEHRQRVVVLQAAELALDGASFRQSLLGDLAPRSRLIGLEPLELENRKRGAGLALIVAWAGTPFPAIAQLWPEAWEDGFALFREYTGDA